MANYRFNEETMFMDISDGVAVVINGETGIYYGMNDFGSCLFEALTKGASVEQIKSTLQKMPEAPANLAAEFDSFVDKLVNYELLIPAAAGSAEFDLDAAVAVKDGFQMEIEAYDDALEMLLADPIHEVREETGWTPEKESIGYSKEETREREKKVKA